VGLMFELPGEPRGRYLIPEALPKNPPDYEMWPEDALRFRFEYDFLPPGLIPRFIVQAHEHLSDQPTRWYTGVVLKAEGCWILVSGDRDKDRIDFSVKGPFGRRRSALSVVLSRLLQVHRLNPEIGPDARVPLPDQWEESVAYEYLLTLEQEEGLDFSFRPEKGRRKYTVRELLEGVRYEFGKLTPEPERGSSRRSGRVAQPAPQPRPAGKWDWLTSWPALSVGSGLGAVVLAVIVWFLPTFQLQLATGVLAAIFVGVAVYVASMNPVYFYRRTLSQVISGGFLVMATGFGIKAYGFEIDNTISAWFYVAWGLICVALIAADVWTQRSRDVVGTRE
ncbi:MAG: COR domain-containing protein, partial [Planctomycetaceae bacterium]|nr:COR domain-containing protein [Planctomycetaceae bacterium]